MVEKPKSTNINEVVDERKKKTTEKKIETSGQAGSMHDSVNATIITCSLV